MAKELICINNKFPPDYLAFYKQHGVIIPEQDNIYSVRSISKNSNGDWEILLNEIINPEVPIKHPILGIAHKEPAWKVSRFANLDQSSISQEEIDEIKKETKLVNTN